MSTGTQNKILVSASAHSQSGIVLPVALIMSAVLMILGLSAMRGASVSEKLSHNLQQKMISAEAALSGVEAVWDADHLKSEVSLDASSSYNYPDKVLQEASLTGLADQFDIVSDKGSLNIDGEVTVQYCGEVEPVGGGLNADESTPSLVGTLIDVTSTASIENSGAKSIVVQRASVTSIGSGRPGSCVLNGV